MIHSKCNVDHFAQYLRFEFNLEIADLTPVRNKRPKTHKYLRLFSFKCVFSLNSQTMSEDSYESPWRRAPPAHTSTNTSHTITNTSNRGYHHPTSRPPRGRGRGSYPRFNQTPRASVDSLPPPKDLLDGLLKERIGDFVIPSKDNKQEEAQITQLTFIGSYNWMGPRESKGTPTILVPG